MFAGNKTTDIRTLNHSIYKKNRQLDINVDSFDLFISTIKFRYSEKATKFEKIFQ